MTREEEVRRGLVPGKPKAPTREDVAEIEVGSTAVGPHLRKLFIGLFLLTILAVPLLQHVIELGAGKASLFWPKANAALLIPGQAWKELSNPAHKTAWAKIQGANARFLRDVKAYEKALEDDSFIAVAAIPPTQVITAKFLGLGNEQVYIGRDGWLFYQPEVSYLTNQGFLSASFLRARSRSGGADDEVQPDALKGILHFRDQLAARGIRLLLLPAPVKPMIEPDHLSSRYAPNSGAVLQNPSYPAFLKALDSAGVDYLDVSNELATKKQLTGRPQFLLADTHWTPEAMELAASRLAEKLRGFAGSSPFAQSQLNRTSEAIAGRGDIAAMLKLPASSRLYPPQTVTIHPVSKPGSLPWAPDAKAEVLVLGDSFSNIYSLEAMGWGKSAGLVEQLAFQLRAPVDAILRNDAAAHATRNLLARDLAQGHDRLAGKKIVVWEFAMRELSVGDWKLIELPPASAHAPVADAAAGRFYCPSDGAAPVRITATVASISKFPRPGSVPYKDHIFSVSLTGLKGPGVPENSCALAYLWSMKDNVLTAASGWKPGAHVTLDVRSWNDVAPEHERFNRSEPEDESLQQETPCWGELIK